MIDIDCENNVANNLNEEDIIDDILTDVKLKKPFKHFNAFLKEKFNKLNSKEGYDVIDTTSQENIKTNNDVEKFFSNLSKEKQDEYKTDFLNEKLNYKKEVEIVKKYIFKGVDGKIKFRITAFQIFLSDRLIDGLNNNFDPKYIRANARSEWNKLTIEQKNEYYLQKKENECVLNLALKYRNINPFILYVYKCLNECKKNKVNIPSLDKLASNWESLSKSDKKTYELYTEDLLSDKYNIRDIYDAIYGIKPKAPAGALRIFLQIKARTNEIKSIKDGVNLWDNLNINEKEKYLKLSHRYFLAYKYKEMIYEKKIRRIYPKKPIDAFQFYLNEKKGIKIPEGCNAIIYWRNKYNELNNESKIKYIRLYNEAIKDFQNKIEEFKDKIFDFPKSPKNPFSFYISIELNNLSNKNDSLELKDNFEILTANWYNNKIDKNKYVDLANKDKKRYKYEISQFEKLGYYYKYDEEMNAKYESAPNIKHKKTSPTSFETKKEKKSLDSKIINNTNINNEVIKSYKGKLQYKV